jgi:hypothetical protein
MAEEGRAEPVDVERRRLGQPGDELEVFGAELIGRPPNGSGDGRGENWPQWWAAVAADPVLADLNAERKHRWAMAANHGSEGGRLATHLGALSAAGFTEIGTLWQHGENRLLCAFKP